MLFELKIIIDRCHELNATLSKSFTFTPPLYSFLMVVLCASGMSFDIFNKQNLFGEYLSINRLAWVSILLYTLAGLRLREIKPNWFVILLTLWAILNISNLLFSDGDTRLIVVRCFQVVFIGTLVLSVSQDNFNIKQFCMALSRKWILLIALSFLFFSTSCLIDFDLFSKLRQSIYGIASNFSIFISQFIAILFFQHFIRRTNCEILGRKYFLVFTLSLLPLLIWQVSSDGRAGLGFTILLISAFFYIERGIFAGALGLLVAIGSIFAIEQFLFFYYQYIGTLALEASSFDPKIFSNFQGGLLRERGTVRHLSPDDLVGFHGLLIYIDTLSSGRVSGLLETYQNITPKVLLFGAGVGNFKILGNEHYPHVELIRHLVELGILGFVISLIVYAMPFRLNALSPVQRFAKAYLLAFLITTLIQPSGPLIHLNSSFLFWVVYGELSKKLN